MATKKVKRKNNITRKKFTSKSIPETITTVYHKLYSDIDNEKSLSCFLANNKIIKAGTNKPVTKAKKTTVKK